MPLTIEAILVKAGMPDPVTVCPTTKPAVLATVTVAFPFVVAELMMELGANVRMPAFRVVVPV